MSTPAHDDPLDRARGLFADQVEALDPATATALRARRREALSAATRHRRAWWWPAGGLATAALALAVWLPRGEPVGPTDPAAPAPIAGTRVTPLPTAAEPDPGEQAARFADGALDELENDAEFYEWLATVPADTEVPALPPDPQEG